MNKTRLTFEAIQKASDGNFYGSDQNGNGIYRINMETGCSSYISLFENEGVKKRLHAKAEKYENQIIFIPASADHITFFDPVTAKQIHKMIPIPPKAYPYYDPRYKFTDSYIFNNLLILLPSSYPGVLIYDIESDSFELIDNWVTNEKFFFRKGSCRIKHTVYLPDTVSDLVISFDLTSTKVRSYHIGKDNKGCWSCNSCNDKDVWFAPKKPGSIIKWTPSDNSIKEYSFFPNGFCTKDFLFSKVYFVGNKPYFIPVYSNMFVTVDEDEEIIRPVACDYINEFTCVVFHFELEDYLYISIISNNESEQGFMISKSDNCLTHLDFYITDGQEKRFSDILRSNRNCLKETHIFDLDSYLSGLESMVNK